MIAATRTALAGPARWAARPGGPGPADPAGRLLARLSVLPALLVLSWLLAGLPLLLLGAFRPLLMLVISVPLAVALALAGLRWIPGLAGPDDADAVAGAAARTPWWPVLAIAAAFGADQMIYHGQFLIVMRDPGSYAQFAAWIAGHHGLPIPQDRAAFGGTHHLLTFDSFAFYQVGSVIVPQFMAGLPMLLAGGFWLGGAATAVAMAPVFGALAVLTFGGLAARLIGPRWAPLAALVLAISLPMQFTSRSTYSEPVAAILFLGGLALVTDSLRVQARPGRAGRARRAGPRRDAAGPDRRRQRHPARAPLRRPAADQPPAAGLAAARRAGRRGGLRCGRRAAAVPALPGQHQDIADPTGRADRPGRGRHRGGGAAAPPPWPARHPRCHGAQRRGRAGLPDPARPGRAAVPADDPGRGEQAHPGGHGGLAARRSPAGPADPAVLGAQPALGVLVHRPARGAARHARRRAAGPALPARPDAGLDSAAGHLRLDHRDHAVPPGHRGRPAVGQPAARPGGAARVSSCWPDGRSAGCSAGCAGTATTARCCCWPVRQAPPRCCCRPR